MEKHTVAVEIDIDGLKNINDEWLKLYWSVAQANPAKSNDPKAGYLATRINDEIVRRWLKNTPEEMYNHSTEQVYYRELVRHCEFVNGAWSIKADKEQADAKG